MKESLIAFALIFSIILVSGISGCAKESEAEKACDSLTTDNGRDICYYALAMQTNDPALCAAAGVYFDDCVKDQLTAKYSTNPQLCEDEAKDDKPSCYSYVATATSNAGLCDKTNYIDPCKSIVAQVKGATTEQDCANLTDGSGKCYYDIALKTKNSGLCEKAAGYRYACMASIQ